MKLVQLHVGEPAQRWLIDEVKERRVKAYARYYWTTSSKDLRGSWKAGPPDDAIERQAVRSAVLTGSRSLYADADRWKWRLGDFFVTHHKAKNKHVRHMYKGVRFDRAGLIAAIEKIRPGSIQATQEPEPKHRNGKWNNWIAELAAWVQEVGISAQTSANHIEQELAERCARKGIPIPTRATVYLTAQVVAERLKQTIHEPEN